MEHGKAKLDLSVCLTTLMAMSTKLQHRPKHTTLERSSLVLIYKGFDREDIRKIWLGFIREIWTRAIPYDENRNKILDILHKNESQTLLHAQDCFAVILYEVIFCNALKDHNANKLKSFNVSVSIDNADINLYEAIPNPHGKLYPFDF